MRLEQALSAYGRLVEPELDRLMPAQDGPEGRAAEAARYSLLAGGKRLRPALLLEFFALCGGRAADALPFACALEMIHTYSLIHDDLPCMDDDDLRRGRPSCHRAFDPATALLAGDGLLNRAFEVMAGESGIEPGRVLRAAGYVARRSGFAGMIGGQVIDLALAGRADVPPQLHLSMAALKTGALFQAACAGACLLAGADRARVEAAEAFAYYYGLAFQLTDDLLDVQGDAALLGKPVGSDAAGDKRTFVTVYGAAACREMAADWLERARQSLAAFGPSEFLEALCSWTESRNR